MVIVMETLASWHIGARQKTGKRLAHFGNNDYLDKILTAFWL